MPNLKLLLLGPPRLERDGTAVDIGRRKAVALLAYLAATGQRHSRDALSALLWPHSNQPRARAALRQNLWALNVALDGDFLSVEREDVGLAENGGLWLDVAHFSRLVAKCRAHSRAPAEPCPACVPDLEEAVALYRGDFLAGFGLGDCAEYDEWQFFQTESLRHDLAGALERLVQCYGAQARFDAAITSARQWLALDPLQELPYRHLMRLHAWAGERSAALRQYQECVQVLDEQLGASPQQATVELYEAIANNQPPPPPARVQTKPEPPVASGRAMPRQTLPIPPTPFVGRQAELAEIDRWFGDARARLLTLIGPGGVGKTRLALQAAAAQQERFRDGVFFVPLADLKSPDHLATAIGDALEFAFTGQADPHEQLRDYLRDKRMLVVLDNFEHLSAGAVRLADLLPANSRSKLLVTSRERLNLRGEQLLDVHGFATRGGRGSDKPDSSAAQLFLLSARRVQPHLVVSNTDRRSVARICRSVDGLPLGIELAAAWARMLTIKEIAAEIERDADFLTTELRDLPARHRSMRAVFEHSWELLAARERDLLLKLSVFRGGFTYEAARQVTQARLPTLLALVNKSLVSRDAAGRYDLHELIRFFAAERLGATKEEQRAVRDRHCETYVQFVAEREADLYAGDRQRAVLAEISADIKNVRAAWRWAVARAHLGWIGQSLHGLARYYQLSALFQEGENAFGRAIDRVRAMLEDSDPPDPAGQRVLATLLAEQGGFFNRQGRYEEAIAAAQRAVELARGVQPAAVEALARLQWAHALMRRGNYGSARSQLEQAVALAHSAQSDEAPARLLVRMIEADGLRMLGAGLANQGEHTEAVGHYERALRIHRAIEDRRGESLALNNLGLAWKEQGDFGAARVYYEQALELLRSIGDRWGETYLLNNLGVLLIDLGDYGRARPIVEQALQFQREVGARLGECKALCNLGLLAHCLGDHNAARDFGQQALRIAEEIQSAPDRGYAWTYLGHALAGLGRLAEAADAYRQALDLRRELGQPQLALDSLAGLAHVALARDDRAQALDHVEEILRYLNASSIDGIDEPFRVYLTCVRVLQAGDDPRAPDLLCNAQTLLQKRAARISDRDLRRSFLQNVPAHRQLLQAAQPA